MPCYQADFLQAVSFQINSQQYKLFNQTKKAYTHNYIIVIYSKFFAQSQPNNVAMKPEMKDFLLCNLVMSLCKVFL